MILVLFEHLETLLLGLYFHDNYYMSNVFTEIIGMAPPINVQDWYGDRHTSQIASGALVHLPGSNWLRRASIRLA